MQRQEEVIIATVPYDINPDNADNYEEFNEHVDPAKLGSHFTQINTLKGSIRKFQYYGPDRLLLNVIKDKHNHDRKFQVNLACLSTDMEHVKSFPRKWLYSALSSLLLTVACLILAYNILSIEPLYLATAGLISFTGTLVFALLFVYHYQDEYIIKSRFGNINLFVVENRKPSPEVFRQFFNGLQQRITAAHAESPVSDSLVNELKMCRRLRDQNILDEESYTRARTAVFRHEQYKA
jgi:hypothetical protein